MRPRQRGWGMVSNVSPRNRLDRILKRRKEALEKVARDAKENEENKETNVGGEVQPNENEEKPDQS